MVGHDRRIDELVSTQPEQPGNDNFSACRSVVQAKFNCPWNRLPKDDITDPAAPLKGSNRPSLNFKAGSAWFGVTKDGVVRVTLSDDDQSKRGDSALAEPLGVQGPHLGVSGGVGAHYPVPSRGLRHPG